MADSQLLKREIENIIKLLEMGDGDSEQTHGVEDKLLWDFVSVVYERSMEPCLTDICERLFRLQATERTKWYA
jgi:hypothetical protein